MLIITRRVGESVIIGDNVKMTILGMKGKQIRIGFEAPKEIAIHREEIHKRIKKEVEAQELMATVITSVPEAPASSPQE